MNQESQQQLQQLVHSSQENFQKGINAIQNRTFNKGSLFFNLAARDNDKISELLKDIQND